MSILMPKLTTRDLAGALDWIDRVTALFETGDLAGLGTTDTTTPTETVLEIVASGVLGSSTSLNVALQGAQLLDLILFCDPFDDPSYDGVGWSTGNFPWINYGYTTYWRWKQLSDLANIARGPSSYQGGWIILRGATSLALVETDDTNTNTLTFNPPTLNADHLGHVVFATDRNGTVAATAPTDWTKELSVADGIFTTEYFVRAPSVALPVAFSPFDTGLAQIGLMFEARS